MLTLQLSKTHSLLTVTLWRNKYTPFFWHSKSADKTWEYGVGFAVRSTLHAITYQPTRGTKCILVTCISTSCSTQDKFYKEFDMVTRRTPVPPEGIPCKALCQPWILGKLPWSLWSGELEWQLEEAAITNSKSPTPYSRPIIAQTAIRTTSSSSGQPLHQPNYHPSAPHLLSSSHLCLQP